MEMTEYGKHGKPKCRLPTLVCFLLRREDVFTFRRRGRSHPRPVLSEPDAKIGRRPSLYMLWRIGGLWSLHVQGQHEEQARGRGQGRYPRLILIWMTTEAVRTGSRELELGSSLSRFMAQLGLQATGGHWGTIPRFRDQIERLVGAAISTRWSSDANGQNQSGGENLLVADRFHLWWTPQELPHGSLAKSSVTLSMNFFEQLVAAPVPLDLRAVRALKRSPLALDLYAWATRRVSYLSRPTLIPWESLRRSFGAGYADTPQGRSCFRAKAIEAFHRIVMVYPELKIESQDNGLLLRPSGPHISKVLR